MSKRAGFFAVSILILAALWWLFKPQAAQDGAPPAMGASSTAPAINPEKAFELVVRGGKLVSGPASMKARDGDRVSLKIEADRKDEVHLHGYDLRAWAAPGEPASLQFTADRTGRFAIELHREHTEIGALEVYPRQVSGK